MPEAVCAASPLIMEGDDKAPNLLKVAEAAEAFGVTERTVWNWINDGQLPRVQPGGPGHAVRVDRRELLRSERRSEEER
jgi:excisionase family DNA binding protein